MNNLSPFFGSCFFGFFLQHAYYLDFQVTSPFHICDVCFTYFISSIPFNKSDNSIAMSLFQNRRPDYISTFMEKLVSWDAVSSRLEAAKARAAEREREEERKKMEIEAEDAAGLEPVEVFLESDVDESEAD